MKEKGEGVELDSFKSRGEGIADRAKVMAGLCVCESGFPGPSGIPEAAQDLQGGVAGCGGRRWVEGVEGVELGRKR